MFRNSHRKRTIAQASPSLFSSPGGAPRHRKSSADTLMCPSVLFTGSVLFFLGHHSHVTFSSPKIHPEEAGSFYTHTKGMSVRALCLRTWVPALRSLKRRKALSAVAECSVPVCLSRYSPQPNKVLPWLGVDLSLGHRIARHLPKLLCG